MGTIYNPKFNVAKSVEITKVNIQQEPTAASSFTPTLGTIPISTEVYVAKIKT